MSLLMMSRTGVSGPLPSATARMAMSRSVIMPTRRSFSPTGTAPASISAMILAASRMVWVGLATRTSRVIASLTRMEISSGLNHLLTQQEIDRGRYQSDRDGDAACHRDRRHGNRKGRLLRGGGFGWRDHQAERGRDGQPTADVRHEHPAHGTVIGNRQRARLRRAARGVLEERE